MKRKLTALLLAVLTLCLCTGAMAAGYPIDTQGKDVSLTVYCANAISNYVTDYNETPFFQEMEKATGIHINFIHPATSGMQEAMNLLFLGKELPDIIMCGNYYDGGVFQGLEDGYFVDLTDYLPEYAPDYWQLITSGDEIWRQVSNGDGRVAAFYTIKEPGDTQHRRMLLTQETLDEIGATIPTTLADVEDVFAKMLAHGVTPYILDKTGYEPQFLGMYDLMKGFYKDAEGNILYGQVQPAFKNYLTLMHDWYEKGYISKGFIGSNTKNNNTLFDTVKVGMYFDSFSAAYIRGVANCKTVVTAPYPRLTEG
ncbi:MAG: extracellular solute-binding protein, partial [Eubacteriales bacterium]|nr:extracellular solute-binding protein [Eubacteriales bacterium]